MTPVRNLVKYDLRNLQPSRTLRSEKISALEDLEPTEILKRNTIEILDTDTQPIIYRGNNALAALTQKG